MQITQGFGLIGALGLLAMSMVGPEQTTPPTQVTFSQHIAPLIESKCLPCHRPEGQAPFELRTYEQVKRHGELIRTQVLSLNMPPTHPHTHFGDFFSVTPPFTSEELVAFQQWMQQGMLEGDPKKEIKLKPIPVPKGTVTLEGGGTSRIRAEGAPYWRVTVLDLPKEGGYLKGIDLLPESPKALRYATIAIVSQAPGLTAGTTFDNAGFMKLPSQSLVGTWAPGYRPLRMPSGVSRRIAPNSQLVVQAQVQPTGKDEPAGFEVSLHLEKTSSPRSTEWVTLTREPLVIEANKTETVKLERKIDRPMELLTVLPEARFFASKVSLTVTYPDKSSKIIFTTNRWNPYWQGNYSPEVPIKLPAGSRLEAEFTYNNDERCPMNEGKKPQRIVSGDEIGDEVCRMHLLLVPG